MHRFSIQLFKSILFFVMILCVASSYSQNTQADSIALIKKYQTNTLKAIKSFDFDDAVMNISMANRLVANFNDFELKAEIMETNVLLQYYLQNYEKAALININTIEIIKSTNKQINLASSYLMQGLINTRQGQFDNAILFFNKADSIYNISQDAEGKALILLGKGILENEKGNPKTAIKFYNAGISEFRKYKYEFQEAFALLNKAEALLACSESNASNPVTKAKNALLLANEIIDKNKYIKLKIDSYKIESQLAMRERDNIKALALFKKYTSKKDSINNVYINAISKTLDEEANVGALKKSIENFKIEVAEKERAERFNQVTNSMSIVIITILSLLTLSLYKNNNLRAKANNLLLDKNTELQLAKEKAEKASLAKAQFLSTITHELRTPLYAVTGLTHLLMEENPKDNQKEHLNSLKFSGEYLLSLINNILDLNKLEANKVEIEKTSFNLKKRISDVLIALKKSADDNETKLVLEFDNSIPTRVLGDAVKLSQVLINLIGNSVKFTQKGEVTVRVTKMNQKGAIITLHFEIEDNGVGISKTKQDSIFETFSQGSLQINRKFGGTGLGLSIVKNLLELMNSKIHLESKLGQGSKFWFDLNLEATKTIDIEALSESTKSDINYEFLEHKNVLIVEDNKINQMITKKILEKNNMTCQVADNGMDAIDLIKKNTFDVVLMDIHMPGISGIEATQKIRLFDATLPIIALTAVTIDENLDSFHKAGFNEIIPKPFKPKEFFEKIYNTIQGQTPRF